MRTSALLLIVPLFLSACHKDDPTPKRPTKVAPKPPAVPFRDLNDPAVWFDAGSMQVHVRGFNVRVFAEGYTYSERLQVPPILKDNPKMGVQGCSQAIGGDMRIDGPGNTAAKLVRSGERLWCEPRSKKCNFELGVYRTLEGTLEPGPSGGHQLSIEGTPERIL